MKDKVNQFSFSRLVERSSANTQSDYDELVEDEDGTTRRRIKTIPSTSSKYIPSRIRIIESIKTMPIRYQTAFLSSLGFLISFGIRCNMGVSVVAMTHNETEKFPNGTVKLIKVNHFED
jgi:hypothetical protein